jgi:AbrB family looped-hinge helix DNA binding protein
MKNSNITKIDSKGRILIPNHIRKDMNVKEGTEIVLIPDTNGQVRMFPLVKEKTVKFKFMLSDLPGSLASIASILAEYKVNIIMSESKTLLRHNLAQWDIIADISECDGNLEKLKTILQKMPTVKNVELVKE